jgi:hypothetical protein
MIVPAIGNPIIYLDFPVKLSCASGFVVLQDSAPLETEKLAEKTKEENP